MFTRISKVVLLVALLTGLVASSAPVLRGSATCSCHSTDPYKRLPPGGCHFDQRALQCVNTSCPGICY